MGQKKREGQYLRKSQQVVATLKKSEEMRGTGEHPEKHNKSVASMKNAPVRFRKRTGAFLQYLVEMALQFCGLSVKIGAET